MSDSAEREDRFGCEVLGFHPVLVFQVIKAFSGDRVGIDMSLRKGELKLFWGII